MKASRQAIKMQKTVEQLVQEVKDLRFEIARLQSAKPKAQRPQPKK